MIDELHDTYIKAAADEKEGWQLFPLAQRELLQRVRTPNDARRITTDFVAALTESMAYELHHRLTGVKLGSILDAAARASR